MEKDNRVLCVAVGNTTTKLGLCEGITPVMSRCVATRSFLTADEAVALCGSLDLPPVPAILASVVPRTTEAWEEGLRLFTGRRPKVVGPGLKTGLKMKYKDPGQIGADRVANAVAAKECYGPSTIVVDFGTATSIEVIDAQGQFAGGIIAPGVRLSIDALAAKAACLSDVEMRLPCAVVGTSTREAMQSGVIFGEVARIRGLLTMIECEQNAEFSVVFTGDFASEIAPFICENAEIDGYLTLRGLACMAQLSSRNRA